MKGEFAKGLVTDAINGVLFIIVLGFFFTGVGWLVGEGFQDITLESFGQSFNMIGENPLLLGVGFLFFIGIGLLVFIFGKFIRPLVGKLVGLAEPEGEIEASKKAYVVTFFAVGVITFILVTAFASFLSGINPEVQITDMSTLTNAISNFAPMFWVVLIFGVIVLGAIVGYIGRNINKIRSGVPDKLAKF